MFGTTSTVTAAAMAAGSEGIVLHWKTVTPKLSPVSTLTQSPKRKDSISIELGHLPLKATVPLHSMLPKQ